MHVIKMTGASCNDLHMAEKTYSPMLALTFDDGPSKYTERISDVFSRCGGKGTFFVLGSCEILRRASKEGHEIGGHSWNHKRLIELKTHAILLEIAATSALIRLVIGKRVSLMRPPYGAYNDRLKAISKKLRLSMILWSVDTVDWKYKDANYVYNTVMESAADGAIVLLHDLHETTAEAMERAIPDLLAKGFRLVTVSELIENIIPGSVYKRRES